MEPADPSGNVITGGADRFAFVSTFDDVAKAAGERNPAYQHQVVASVAVPTR